MSGHPQFKAITEEMWELHQSKAGDYGSDDDPLLNMRDLKDYGLPEWYMPAFRIGEKVRRVKSFIRNGSLNHDNIENDLIDIACLSAIALILIREEKSQRNAEVADAQFEFEQKQIPVSEK